MKNNDLEFTARGWQQRYGIMVAVWSVLVGGSLLWAMHQETRITLGAATAAARANISKDILFRKWATSHGGVYVTPTEHTPPNPYLKLPDRDVVTTTGKKLTLMNPAYMLRELQSDFSDDYGSRSHITSLKLLNPKNAPDAWENKVLHAFEQGEKERLEVQQIDGQPYLRMMLPFITEQGCLKCHGFQGYKVGEIRGGLSTAISLAPYLARERELGVSLALTHGAIWLFGLAGLGVSYRRDSNLSAERQKAANDLRESEQKYHMVADYTSDWEYWIGVKGEIIYMSPSCQALTGHDVDEFSANPELLVTLVHPDDQAIYEAHRHAHSEHAVEGEAEFRIVSKDGEVHWISHRCRPVFDLRGNWLGIRVGNRDITARRTAEDKIIELNRDLERRVIERTEQLEAANQEMEAFSYSVSHDLRTPLRAIDGFSRILLDDYTNKLDDEGRRLLNVVRDNTSRMGQLIDDILKFSRTGRLELTFSEIDMERLAREVAEELKPADDNLQLEIEPVPKAWGDRAMMRQVFINLLSNAIKFCQSSDVVRIKVGGSIEGDEVIYYVKDNGAGFDMQYVNKLFGVFQRLHSMTEFEGTGIGLAIVKRIITRHGGRVWAEGKVGEGATIYFALPKKEVEHG
ncbi:MAG: ATP-binding protein [Gallionella sp.]|jgi:PAS domain S-box-containing protein